MKKMVAICVAVVPLCSHASDWNYVAGSDKSAYIVDFSTVAQAGAFKKVWFRTVFFAPQTLEKSSPPKTYESELGLYYFDCKERKFTTTQVIKNEAVTGDGEVISHWSGPLSAAGMVDIAPDSMAEQMLRAACSTGKEREKIKIENRPVTQSMFEMFARLKASQGK